MTHQSDKMIRVSLRRIEELKYGVATTQQDRLIEIALSEVERLVREFDPNQPRDEDGKWTDDGGGSEGGGTSESGSKPGALSAREQEAIDYYQGHEGFEKINGGLRSGKPPGADARALDSAIAKSELSADMTVYRGVGNTLTKKIVAMWEEDGKASFVDKGFVSTSSSKDIASTFSKNMIEIKLPKGYNALSITDREFSHEKEILLARGTKFKVLDIRKTAVGWRRMRVEIIK